MTKNEMIKKMTDICFKAHGVSLQLQAGQLLKAAAATTPEERCKYLKAGVRTFASIKLLMIYCGLVAEIHPEHLEVDELPEPFDKLENMSEEEIGEWIVSEMKNGKEMTEEK
jgi:hypothetical protein